MKFSPSNIEVVSLRVFFVCMFLCASLFIVALWVEPEPEDVVMKPIATLFVVGFASFLTWLPIMLYKLSNK